MKSRGELNTEKRNEFSTSIDSMSIKDILQTINQEDSKIIDAVKTAIPSCIEKLVKRFPNQVVGVKDSSYNLFEKLKLKNFSIFPGSELKLLKGLELGCSGIITATCNVTAEMSRKVYDDYFSGKKQTQNEKLCSVREAFDKYNLISGLHTFCSKQDKIYKNILPPLSLLSQGDEKNLIDSLKNLNFNNKSSLAA